MRVTYAQNWNLIMLYSNGMKPNPPKNVPLKKTLISFGLKFQGKHCLNRGVVAKRISHLLMAQRDPGSKLGGGKKIKIKIVCSVHLKK